jgi:hypothetical protein
MLVGILTRSDLVDAIQRILSEQGPVLLPRIPRTFAASAFVFAESGILPVYDL